jgi:hypothetical protein
VSASASASTRSSSTAFQIIPQASAVAPSMVSASIIAARARASPIIRGRKKVPPESGTRPIFEKAWTNFAERPATTMSQASAMLAPAPAATPWTAQTTGFSSARMRLTMGL